MSQVFSLVAVVFTFLVALSNVILTAEIVSSEQIISSVSEDASNYSYVKACNIISSAENPDAFHNFRRIQPYVTVVEPTALWLAEAYMQYIAQNYSWIIANETIFNKVIQIDAYGKPYMHNIIINNQIRIKVSALALRFGAFIGKISKKIFSRQFSTVDGAQKISSVL